MVHNNFFVALGDKDYVSKYWRKLNKKFSLVRIFNYNSQSWKKFKMKKNSSNIQGLFKEFLIPVKDYEKKVLDLKLNWIFLKNVLMWIEIDRTYWEDSVCGWNGSEWQVNEL